MSRFQANCILLLTAFIWGTTFVVQKTAFIGLDEASPNSGLGPLTFSGVRFLLGMLVVIPFAVREHRRAEQRATRRLDRTDWLSFAVCGCFLLAGSTFQQIGIITTTVANAGFLTALYVPLVPLMALVAFRRWPHWAVWPAVVCSAAGAFYLNGGHLDGFGSGDLWVLLGTIFWALHVTSVGKAVDRAKSPLRLAVVQFAVCGALGTVLGLLTEPVTWQGLSSAWFEIAYAGFLSAGVAFTLQVVGQNHTHPADAAVIMSTEMLFAALAGVLVLGERLSMTQIGGAALILGGLLLVDLLPFLGRRRMRRI